MTARTPVAPELEKAMTRHGRPKTGPIRDKSKVTILDSGDPGFINRLLIGTPTRGTVRIEWHAAMRGLMIPANWSSVSMNAGLNMFLPVRFTVAHGQNMIVREVVNRDFEWLLFIEDDTIPPIDLLVRLADYVKDGPPVVSGLYFTKSFPSEPVMYRGRGNGAYTNWKPGDKVWCDGVPMGCTLIHASILKAMWEDSEEYTVGAETTREVFLSPTRAWISPDGDVNAATGTSDLEWCTRVIEGGYLKKAGWEKFARKRYPFLVDTNIFCRHITPDGMVFPPA